MDLISRKSKELFVDFTLGLVTRRKNGILMSADLTNLEFFWLGTAIVVDGRVANSNFLRKSLNGNWICSYNLDTNLHFPHD